MFTQCPANTSGRTYSTVGTHGGGAVAVDVANLYTNYIFNRKCGTQVHMVARAVACGGSGHRG